MIDLNLLGKRYVELTETISVNEDTLFSVYRVGQPENNKFTFLNLQRNIRLSNTFDFHQEELINGRFTKWSSSENKFTLGTVDVADVPNLDASKITTGVFSETRIPSLPISKITNLQTELNSKEPNFSKGSVTSTTLQISGGQNRLFGDQQMVIDVDVESLISQLRFFNSIRDSEGEEQISAENSSFIQLESSGGVNISFESGNRVVFSSIGPGSSKKHEIEWNFGDSNIFELPESASSMELVHINGIKAREVYVEHSYGSNMVELNPNLFPSEDSGQTWIVEFYYFVGGQPSISDETFDQTFDQTFG